MNKIILTGRLSNEIEMKKSGEHKYGRFNLAVPRTGKKDEADFINCTVFGKTAEVMFEYCRKGHRIGVEGHLQISQYEKDGKKLSGYSVIVEKIEFLQDKNEKSKSDSPSEPQDASPSQVVNPGDDEFPF